MERDFSNINAVQFGFAAFQAFQIYEFSKTKICNRFFFIMTTYFGKGFGNCNNIGRQTSDIAIKNVEPLVTLSNSKGEKQQLGFSN